MNKYNNSNESEIRSFIGNGNLINNKSYGRNLDYLTGEMHSIIARELDSLMNTVNNHVQRVINSAIAEQVLPQIQASLRNTRCVNQQRGRSPTR